MTPETLRVGVVTPHRAPGPEVELPASSQGRVRVVLARTGPPPTSSHPSVDPTTFDDVVAAFAGFSIDAVAHASTTTGYVIGRQKEQAVVDRLSLLCDLPAVASCAAAVAELRSREVTRLQLVHPPWFDHELDALGVGYFRDQGFDVVVSRASEVPAAPALVRPQHVIDWVEQHVDDLADGVFLAGNGFRTAAVVDELGRRTGRCVVSANGALLSAIDSALSGAR